MTRFSLPLRLALAGLLFVTLLPRANADADTGSLSYEESPSNDFLVDTEMPTTGATLSDGGACTSVVIVPFPQSDSPAGPLPSDSTDCEAGAINRNSRVSVDGGLTGELFVVPVLVQPQPSDGELMVVNPADATAPPQGPFSPWPLVGVATAIVLIGGSSILRFRRISAHRT
jgi:hypothetical protein